MKRFDFICNQEDWSFLTAKAKELDVSAADLMRQIFNRYEWSLENKVNRDYLRCILRGQDKSGLDFDQ